MTIISPLEKVLVDTGEETMFPFRKKEKSSGGEPENPSRRKFMKNAAIAGAGAMAASKGGLISKAMAKEKKPDYNGVPPGIYHCRDQDVKYAYMLWHGMADYPSGRGYSRSQYTQMVMKLNPDNQVPHTVINADTPFKEPAYHYLLSELVTEGISGEYTYEEIKKKNPPLADFSAGISNYFITWVRREYDASYDTEKRFLYSIFLAAGRSQKDAEGFMELEDMGERERILQGLMSELKKKSFDEQLCAAWSGFVLTDHYAKKLGSDSQQAQITYSEVEQKTKKMIGHPIRGPPHYPSMKL